MNKSIAKSWIRRAKTIKRSAERLRSEAMDNEADGYGMSPSDWADNIEIAATDFIEAVSLILKKQAIK